eukprot:CAMPEP_0114341438 /NCGR_PEP_ID=MMETSP0101-20121206/9048_1 /TAXON_ID=38822 ORGANISM="Pteridomonas danica, Strain PT" /NCGR_SAMPLE_ID=MMETSP0101 /ASSEMBLY_ACC=CAM_ASM_000211 /LENGTH=235 /DNA_ID=CAMNT_0001475043 /DNA_START=1168 /DNA_END=1872 /DNA_ORIENTATION=-
MKNFNRTQNVNGSITAHDIVKSTSNVGVIGERTSSSPRVLQSGPTEGTTEDDAIKKKPKRNRNKNKNKGIAKEASEEEMKSASSSKPLATATSSPCPPVSSSFVSSPLPSTSLHPPHPPSQLPSASLTSPSASTSSSSPFLSSTPTFPPNSLIDIGVNLTSGAFSKDQRQVVERAAAVGVSPLIITGLNIQGSMKASQLCDTLCSSSSLHSVGSSGSELSLYFTAGIHPHEAKTW